MIREYFYDCPHCGVEQQFTDPDLLETKVACSDCKGKAMLPDMLDFREVEEPELNEEAAEAGDYDMKDFVSAYGVAPDTSTEPEEAINPSDSSNALKQKSQSQSPQSENSGNSQNRVRRRGGRSRTVIKRRNNQ